MARQPELREIEHLTAAAAAGRGGAVVLSGELGIGKSTLVEAAVSGLEGFEVLRADGTEFEQDLLHAVLHQLCSPALAHLHRLPPVQREALEVVFGLGRGPSPGPLTVGLAVLGLLREAARRRPVCCVVDDAQWLDEGSRRVLGFVARRLDAERIAMIFAARNVDAVPSLSDLPRLPLEGLSDEDARTLLGAASNAPHAALDAEVFERILAEASGNPLALVEFAHDAGPFGVPGPRNRHAGVITSLETHIARRLEQVPAAVRELVVLAAADPVGDPRLLRHAAGLLGLDLADLAVAENAGILTLGARLRFRHPLVRSTAYGLAAPRVRRRVHGALAEATEPESDADRRAWHRAHAVLDADEDAAAELERSADRARSRGGFAAAAAFMERAGQLTPASEGQARRLLAAAQLRLRAGTPAAARALVDRAELRLLEEPAYTQARLLRARVDYQLSRSPQATAALVDIVTEFAPEQARETCLEVFASIMFNENDPALLRDLGTRMRERAPRPDSSQPADLLLDALLDQFMLPVPEAVPGMRGAADACRAAAVSGSAGSWQLILGSQLFIDLRDAEGLVQMADRNVEGARRQRALAILPQALRYQAIAWITVGRLEETGALLAEARAIDEAAGTVPLLGAELVHTAFCGDADHFRKLCRTAGEGRRLVESVGEQHAWTVLHNGLGDHEAALESALEIQSGLQAGTYGLWAVSRELVEAAARTGRVQEAATAMRHLEALAAANPTPWALADWLQARALLGQGEDEDREPLYQQAIDHLAPTRARLPYARARLTYGEWLRSENRHAEARVELRVAHDLLASMGARGFAARAARALRAAGAQTHARGGNLDQLTAKERLVVQQVAAGATSKEVGALLFLSPRTIDTHLRNVYRKLGITSRRQLRRMPL
ncbi:AAA family ATPase [Streptomyces sp. PU-14G]|uniref:helix-turn-helix transcriptional regulator n=1 Tax=Streptomyces sp. PU-14G TaxID=2800808 RepID=UPI0034E0350D